MAVLVLLLLRWVEDYLLLPSACLLLLLLRRVEVGLTPPHTRGNFLFGQKRKSPKKLPRDRVAIQESGCRFAQPGEYVINRPISRRLEHAAGHGTAPDRPRVQTRHEPPHRRRTRSATPIRPHRPPIAANNSRSLKSAPPADHSRHGNNHGHALSLKARAIK